MKDFTREIFLGTGKTKEQISETEYLKLQKQAGIISAEWDTLGISNDFVFCKIMQDEALLEELVRIIIPEVDFVKLEVISQKTIDIGQDIHGVRFDIYAKSEDGKVIEIEMQVLNRENLPRRLRFYGSAVDAEMLEKGVSYSKLKDSYIIAICLFDYYGKGLHKYTFSNRCHEASVLEMGDGTTKIVLNALGTEDDVDGRLKEFLDYVAGKTSDDDYVRRLDLAVEKARSNKEWRREYMLLSMRDYDNREEGRIQQMKETIEKLLKKGKSLDEIADLCEFPLELVKSVQDEMTVSN